MAEKLIYNKWILHLHQALQIYVDSFTATYSLHNQSR